MTREKAIHKIDFSIKAYQNLIDQNVCSGKVLGDGVKGSWKSDKAPLQEYQEMIDALKMAKDALQEKPHCIAAITLSEEKMREYCHEAAQELFERIDEAFKNRGVAEKVKYISDGHLMYDMAQCPACGKAFGKDYSEWLDPFCSHCGQKLDWSFEESEET
jgi:predicted amidophosphoribosyltransferase